MTGHDRAAITAHWIKTKPMKGDKQINLEDYIKQVCKQKGWIYKLPIKKEQ